MVELRTAIIPLVIAIVSAMTCHILAKQKGRKPVFWGVMGVVFGPFAIPVILLLGKD